MPKDHKCLWCMKKGCVEQCENPFVLDRSVDSFIHQFGGKMVEIEDMTEKMNPIGYLTYRRHPQHFVFLKVLSENESKRSSGMFNITDDMIQNGLHVREITDGEKDSLSSYLLMKNVTIGPYYDLPGWIPMQRDESGRHGVSKYEPDMFEYPFPPVT